MENLPSALSNIHQAKPISDTPSVKVSKKMAKPIFDTQSLLQASFNFLPPGIRIKLLKRP